MWRPTIRLRLTLLYGGLFFIAGLILVGVTYRLIVQALPLTAIERQIEQLQERGGNDREFRNLQSQLNERKQALRVVRDRARTVLVVESIGAMILGWFVAGRILRPIRTITEHARHASASNLGERLAMRGPPDDLHRLADTIDEMLDRIETAYDSQRQFSARVSHELRTPLALMAAAADLAIAKDGSPIELAETIKTSVTRSEHMIAGLLALSRSENAALVMADCDLAEIVGASLEQLALLATKTGIEIRNVDIESVVVRGDDVLLGHCVINLVENAILHNRTDGWIDVTLDRTATDAQLLIVNSGPQITESEIASIFAPYRRGIQPDSGTPAGHGLGLAVVRSVANAHNARIDARPGPDGGLAIRLSIPLALPI